MKNYSLQKLRASLLLTMVVCFLAVCTGCSHRNKKITGSDVIGHWVEVKAIPTEYIFYDNGVCQEETFTGWKDLSWKMNGDTIFIEGASKYNHVYDHVYIAEEQKDSVIENHKISVMILKEIVSKYSYAGTYNGVFEAEHLMSMLKERVGTGWLLSEDGVGWLETEQGQMWLITGDGQAWLKTDEGIERFATEEKERMWVDYEGLQRVQKSLQ